MGDISDTLELGSAVNRSVEGNGVSRANLDHSMVAIRHRDFNQDSIEFQNRDDISERSFVGHNNNDIKLSASFTAA